MQLEDDSFTRENGLPLIAFSYTIPSLNIQVKNDFQEYHSRGMLFI